MTQATEATYVRAPQVLARHVAGELVLVSTAPIAAVDAETPALITLNETGELLWGLLAEPRTLPDLAQTLMNTFDVSESQARADIRVFLDDLIGCGVVRVEEV